MPNYRTKGDKDFFILWAVEACGTFIAQKEA
jgi:hypothetical protein